MQISITQKYMALNSRYRIEDASGKLLFSAESQIGSVTFFRADGSVTHTLRVTEPHFFSFFHIFNAAEQEIGFMQEKFHMPYFRNAYIRVEDKEYKFKCGPIHMKAFEKKGGKWDKKRPVVYGKKKIARIADTYKLTIDEKRVKVSVGVILGLYYDLIRHNNQH